LTEADLALFDGTSVHLFPGTQVQLRALRLGRFSDSASQVDVAQSKGAARYAVAGGLPNGEGIAVTTPHGTVGLQRGEYLVRVDDQGTTVSAYSGKGHVGLADRSERFRFGQRIRFNTGSVEGP